jgi:hypothetical protein
MDVNPHPNLLSFLNLVCTISRTGVSEDGKWEPPGILGGIQRII